MSMEKFCPLPLCTLIGSFRKDLYIVSLVVILRNWVCDNWLHQLPNVGMFVQTTGSKTAPLQVTLRFRLLSMYLGQQAGLTCCGAKVLTKRAHAFALDFRRQVVTNGVLLHGRARLESLQQTGHLLWKLMMTHRCCPERRTDRAQRLSCVRELRNVSRPHLRDHSACEMPTQLLPSSQKNDYDR